MGICSKVNPLLTLEYMQSEHENKYFDRKSARIRAKDLAPLISAFANADGGTVILGISDKSKELEGIDFAGEDKINDFLNASRDFCRPMPRCQEEFLNITNVNGKQDRLLLLHVLASSDQVIRTSDDRTFLRIGDKTREMLGENLRNLEYSKGTRHFEDEIQTGAKMEDLDEELLTQYKKKIDAEKVPSERVLRARGFLVEKDGQEYLTNAAVLLFAKNIRQFYPNCRVRFVRYEGVSAGTGTRLNITKDVNIEYSILRIIDKAIEFIGTQLREFTSLNAESGKFQTVPEYPEFAWKEGIVNAVTHREYAMSGSFIKVSMYDDRLEIESPGKLPDVVTVNNIQETRYSRNPVISRVLTEFGWVRELNEGVKRIYAEMRDSFLDEPEYYDSGQSVKLILRNNIVARRIRQNGNMPARIPADIWEQLDETEQQILTYLMGRGKASRLEIERYIGKSATTVRKKLGHLLQLDVVKMNGNKYDPSLTYEIRL